MGYRSQPCVAPIPCAFATSLGLPGVAPQRVIAFFHKLNMSNFSVFMRVPASSYLAALVRPKIISTQRVSSPLLRGGHRPAPQATRDVGRRATLHTPLRSVTNATSGGLQPAADGSYASGAAFRELLFGIRPSM